MHVCIHTYMNKFLTYSTHTHTTHTCIHTCIHTRFHTHTNTNTHM